MSVLDENFVLKVADAYKVNVEFCGDDNLMKSHVKDFRSWIDYTGPGESGYRTNRSILSRRIENSIGLLEDWGEEYENIKKILMDSINPESWRYGMWRCRKDTDLNGDLLGMMIELWVGTKKRHTQIVYVYIVKQ